MKKRFFISIKTQLVSTFIIIGFLITVVVTYFNFNTNILQQKSSFVQNSIIQANLLADFSVSALVFMDTDGMRDNLNKLTNNRDILQVIVLNSDKNIFARYNPRNLEIPANTSYTDVNIEDVNRFFDNGILKISVPIQHKNQIYGTLYMEKSTQIINDLTKQLFIKILTFATILIVIIYFISLFLGNYLLKPILSLAKTAEEIANTKDYKKRVKIRSKNEIGILYRAFNTLLKDTLHLTNDLEEQINLRTKELQDSLENLKNTQQQLIESEKMSALGNLVSGVAHEVNTPLGNALTSSTIISKETNELLENLANGTLKRSTMENKLEILNQTSKVLQKTLEYASNLIKSFKQISVDQATDDIRIFDIKNYIQEIILTNANKLKVISAKTEIICKDEVVEIKNSPGAIAQIFNNFIQNSILHGFDNFEGEPKITIKIEKRANKLLLTYKDNGVGINEDIKDKIFEPFVTTKRNAGGTGLGLNIVYNLIYQKLKGSLQVKSEKNYGVEFIITIPNQ